MPDAFRPVVVRAPRPRRRWLLPLAGGLILPLDPMLGVAMLVAGLWAVRRRPPPKPGR